MSQNAEQLANDDAMLLPQQGLEASHASSAGQPPITFIVVPASSTPTLAREGADMGTMSYVSRHERALGRAFEGSDATRSDHASMNSLAYNFRLKPRTFGRGAASLSTCSQGRKRTSSTMNGSDEQASHSSASEGECSASSGFVKVSQEEWNDNSVAQPDMADAPRTAHFEPASPARMASATDILHSLSLQSPASTCSNQVLQRAEPVCSPFASKFRSSFSKYSGLSPTSGRMRAGSLASSESSSKIMPRSTPAGPTISTPKLAPLTVWTQSEMSSPGPRPPLHLGKAPFMYSLDESAITSGPGYSSHDWISAAAANNAGEELQLTPANKAGRTDIVESPGKRSLSSRSERTPLPKVSLTPRSVARTDVDSLPHFPSPSEVGEIMTPGPFLMSSSMTNPEYSAQAQWPTNASSSTIIPQRVSRGNSERTQGEPPIRDLYTDQGSVCQDMKPPAVVPRPQSLLHPPRCPTSPFSWLARAQNADMESLSDSDDENMFILATPFVIAEEKGSHQQQQGSAKRRASERSFGLVGFLSTNSLASMANASLHGVEFVGSVCQLNGNSEDSCKDSPNYENNRFSSPSLSCGESKLEPDPSTFSTSADDVVSRREKDLKTPPAMNQALVSPPLPPSNWYRSPNRHKATPQESSQDTLVESIS